MFSLTALAAAMLTLGASGAQALPVIPGAAGYGMDTRAGRGGKVYRVTNLNADGAGSLKACVDGETARVCVFEVSGTIKLTQDMKIRFDYLTIAGQTAPSPGILIRGGALRVGASNILIQHIRTRIGDDPVGPDPENRDAFMIQGTDTRPVNNIVIDHCSFSWSIDEVASVWGPHDNITFSNNIFSEPLNNSLHKTADGKSHEDHGFGPLLGSSPTGGHITMVGNLMAHAVERNPLSRARGLVFVNNLVYDRVNMDYEGQSENGLVTKTSLVGNVFVKGPSYERASRPLLLQTNGSHTLVSGSRVYVSDDFSTITGTAVSSLLTYTGGDHISSLLTSTLPVWNSGLTVLKTANNGVYNSVLKNAGARPADRDSVDKRIVADVKDRSGGIINCVASNGTTRCNKNAGGWPYIGHHIRRLTIPSNPSTVASNGYTNLENWLHSMDNSVQGTTSSSESPSSPASMSVR